MTYQQTIDYLSSTLPMFSRIGMAAYKTDLTNTIHLCNFLNNPQSCFKSVHIAGTNGKGSTSHMLAAILQMAGYKTGLYTSPHLKDFRERIKINGEMVRQEFVVEFVKRIQPTLEKIKPSFFEITVAMAFEYFFEERVDIAIIETGLGGRLDSTNIIQPELSIITNIGWDHMNILGNSLEKIAMEKAGIIKQGIPVVIGEATESVRAVFVEKAIAENAPIVFASEQFHAIDWDYRRYELIVEIARDQVSEKNFYHLDLPGLYQAKNLVSVLAAVKQLEKQGWILYDTQIKNGLRNTKKLTGLHGRWELVHEHPDVILDVAHNAEGINQIIRHLELIEPKHLHIVIGLVRDKDVEKVLQMLPAYAQYYFTQAQIPRAMEAETLKEKAKNFELKGEAFTDVNAALKQARSVATKDDLVMVCGSVFVVGEVEI
jgi:dihydrofolate synthase/folylpolyglutamate synthase